jgi:hypothetical protein
MTDQQLKEKMEKSIELSIIDLKAEGIETPTLFDILANSIPFIK